MHMHIHACVSIASSKHEDTRYCDRRNSSAGAHTLRDSESYVNRRIWEAAGSHLSDGNYQFFPCTLSALAVRKVLTLREQKLSFECNWRDSGRASLFSPATPGAFVSKTPVPFRAVTCEDAFSIYANKFARLRSNGCWDLYARAVSVCRQRRLLEAGENERKPHKKLSTSPPSLSMPRTHVLSGYWKSVSRSSNQIHGDKTQTRVLRVLVYDRNLRKGALEANAQFVTHRGISKTSSLCSGDEKFRGGASRKSQVLQLNS